MAIYNPGPVPADPGDLPAFLRRELSNLALALQESNQYLLLETQYAPPKKTREGMVIKADGTTWNPGAGAGVYVLVGGGWSKL